MPSIYQAASVIDAQIVVDALRASGLDAHVTGGYLSGAAGELPPTGLVGVWLREAQHTERAKAIIQELESVSVAVGPDRVCPSCAESLGSQFSHCWQCGSWLGHD